MVMIVFAVSISTGLSAGARLSTQDSKIDVNVTVPVRLTKGEPVMADIAVSNGLNRTVSVDMGWDQIGAFEVEVVAPSGRRKRGTVEPPPLGGLSRKSIVFLKPQDRLTRFWPITQWLDGQELGRFELLFRFSGRVRDERGVEVPTTREWRRL